MTYRFGTRCRFTLVEMLFVIAIILLLASALSPLLSRSKNQARYVRWKGYNATLNSDPDVVLNFNFEERDFFTTRDGVQLNALRNAAAACDADDYKVEDYHGILRRTPEWTRGRWRNKGALQFDGRRDYVQVIGQAALNFVPSKDDFTIMTWVNLDDPRRVNTIFSKSDWNPTAQYDVYTAYGRLESDVGGSSRTPWGIFLQPRPQAGQWIHLALRNHQGHFELFYNGKSMRNYWSDRSGSTTSNNSFILGAAGMYRRHPRALPRTRYYMKGRMDEMLVIKRAMSDEDIQAHYKMGTP